MDSASPGRVDAVFGKDLTVGRPMTDNPRNPSFGRAVSAGWPARMVCRSEWMRWKWAVLSALGVMATGGCAVNRAGVIGDLPAPLLDVRFPQSVRARRPVTRLAVPTPLEHGEWERPYWQPPGGINGRWTHVIIHHSGTSSGDAGRFDSYHRNVKGWDELGYHFVIGNGTNSRDGEVEVGSRWVKQKTGAHCKTPGNYYNEHGIGICLVGDYRGAGPSAAQMASLTRLVRFLMLRCGISPDEVVTHRRVTGKTVCPGPKFPMYALRRSLVGRVDASVLP